MSVEDLEQEVIRLSNKWDLYRLPTRATRFEKMCEEFEELIDELFPPDGFRVDMERVGMEAGGLLVTIIDLLHPEGLSAAGAIARAHEKNCKKAGKMVDGTFVKAEDCEDVCVYCAGSGEWEVGQQRYVIEFL